MSNTTTPAIDFSSLSPHDQYLVNVLKTFDEADQDVVGLGALIGFIFAGGVAQIFSLFLHRLKDCKSHSLRPNGAATKKHITFRMIRIITPSVVDDPLQFWINIVSTLLVGLSDQQVLMGALLLIIIVATKGASFSMYFAQFISFFTLITHAATVVAMRPYFRKFKKLAAIRIGVMLVGYLIFIFANASIFRIMDEINAAAWYQAVAGSDQTISDLHQALSVMFGVEISILTWVYLSMVPSLFVPSSLIKVRKAVATWPLRKGGLDDSDDIVREWIQRRSTGRDTRNSMTRTLGNIILWPATLFCRIMLHTKSKVMRAVLWLIAEIFLPWALVPVALLALFLTMLVLLCETANLFKSETKWTFGQILPIAVVALPFWALIQGYAEDWQWAIDEKKKVEEKIEDGGSNTSGDKQHMLNSVISLEPIDEESIVAVHKQRTEIYAGED